MGRFDVCSSNQVAPIHTLSPDWRWGGYVCINPRGDIRKVTAKKLCSFKHTVLWKCIRISWCLQKCVKLPFSDPSHMVLYAPVMMGRRETNRRFAQGRSSLNLPVNCTKYDWICVAASNLLAVLGCQAKARCYIIVPHTNTFFFCNCHNPHCQ